jgi:hypothetical protein
MALAKRDDVELRVFLMGDAVDHALADQQTPEGYYNLARMPKGLIARNAEVGLRVVRPRLSHLLRAIQARDQRTAPSSAR